MYSYLDSNKVFDWHHNWYEEEDETMKTYLFSDSHLNEGNIATYCIAVGPYLLLRSLNAWVMVPRLMKPKYTAIRATMARIIPILSTFLIRKPIIKPTTRGITKTTIVGSPEIVPPSRLIKSFTMLIVSQSMYGTR